MKATNNKLYILLSFLLLIASIGCEKMEDTYREFVEDGEIVYTAKADSIEVRGGHNRAEVSWLLLSDPKVSSYKLYWNSDQDSLEGTLTKTQDVDTVRVMLEGMKEGTHYFKIYMYDNEGNRSIANEATGVVYGDRYIGSLLDRTFNDIRRLGDDIEVEWMPADETLVQVEVRYSDKEGNLINRIVPDSTEIDTLLNFPSNGVFEYRSAFVPDENALDTFYTDYLEVEIDDRTMRGLNLYFSTAVQYGSQENQLSVLVSTDFDGVYEMENIKAATWTDITNEYALATGTSATYWGPMELSYLFVKDKPVYIAFRYITLPQDENGNQRTWRVRHLTLTSKNDELISDQEDASFTLIHDGPFEPNRSSISSSQIILRGNNGDTETRTEDWAISKPIY